MLEVRAARTEELDAAGLCLGRAFRGDPEDIRGLAEDFKKALTRDTVYKLDNTRVAVLDGAVVSVVQVADRAMLIGGVSVRQGFINFVGTDPAYQRHGYGALLLWDAAEYMAREGYPLSLIPGEGVERFYERGGWRNFHHYYKLSFRLPTTFPGVAFQGEVRPAHLEHDLDGILSIFAANHLDVSGPAVRTRGFWLEYARDWELDYPIYDVATVGDRLVAYLRNGYGRRIVELGLLPGAEDAGRALIVHACREARAAGQEELETVELHPFHSWLETHGFGLTREWVSGYLYRIHRLVSLLEELLPAMQKRWDASSVSGWTGSVLLASEVGSACVEAHGGSLSITPTATEPTIRLRVTHAQLIDLLFGQADLRFLPVEPPAQWETALEVLGTLFPRHTFRWYPKDAI